MRKKKKYQSPLENEPWYKAWDEFRHHFGYCSEVSSEVALQEIPEAIEEFIAVLEKSVRDDFDYTIERYGTTPRIIGESDGIIWD